MEELYPLVESTEYFIHLKKRLNIFETPAKRELLVIQKLEYILKNFDLGFVQVILDENAKYPKYTKNKQAVFPLIHEEKNFFDVALVVSEIIMIEFLKEKKIYEELFASIYKNVLSKLYKIDLAITESIFNSIGITTHDNYEMIHDSFVNKEAWNLVNKEFGFNPTDMKKTVSTHMTYYNFNKNCEDHIKKIIVSVLTNKKVKVFLVKNALSSKS